MNDSKLIARCVAKDESAWDDFLQRYSRLIYNYIYSTLKMKGEFITDSPEDLFNEIIAMLIKDKCKKLKSFRGKNGCSLASWLRTVTVNFTIDYIRRLKPLIPLEEEAEEDNRIKPALESSFPLELREEIAEQEKQKQLSDCIERLSIDDKYFLELYLRRQMPLDKVKSVLRLSKPAADMRRVRIIQRIRDCFKRKGFLLNS